jgi:hypothetical protein
MAARHNRFWTINECLQLQREYELLGWTIQQIAEKHQRTPNAIMHKLDAERFADYNTLYSNYHNPSQGLQQFHSEPWFNGTEEYADADSEYECESNMDTDSDVTTKEYIKSLEKQVKKLTLLLSKNA